MTVVLQMGLWAPFTHAFRNKIHLLLPGPRPACKGMLQPTDAHTTDYTEVDCKRCLKAMARGVTLTVKD